MSAQQNSSSALGVLVGCAFLLVLALGLLAIGAGFWYVRMSVARQEAMVQRDVAISRQREAEAMRDEMLESQSPVTDAAQVARPMPLLSIGIDRDGGIQIDGESMALSNIPGRIRSLGPQSQQLPVLEIQAHPAVTAAQIEQLMRACDPSGELTFRLSTQIK